MIEYFLAGNKIPTFLKRIEGKVTTSLEANCDMQMC
jgi:hypothetical protein